MSGMLDVLAAAAQVQALCERNGWRYCLIGGVAVQRWGKPRFTVDVDITLLTGFGGEERFIDALLLDLEPRRNDARAFAIQHRVLLTRTKSGVDVDIALGGLPFEERTVERASSWQVDDGQLLLTCSAEDLIIHKAFAGRDRDWDDIRGILTRQNEKLDWSVVRYELPPLLELKETPEAMERLERLAGEVKAQLLAP